MENVQLSVEGTILTIKVDLSQRLRESASGKTTIVATTSGNVDVPRTPKMRLGLNVYVKGA